MIKATKDVLMNNELIKNPRLEMLVKIKIKIKLNLKILKRKRNNLSKKNLLKVDK